VAQRKRVGLITQRSEDRNLVELSFGEIQTEFLYYINFVLHDEISLQDRNLAELIFGEIQTEFLHYLYFFTTGCNCCREIEM
jgi:hypothetical protein